MTSFKLKRKERKAKNKKKRTPAKEIKLKMTMEETRQYRERKLLCRNAINNRHQKRGHDKPDEK